VWARLAAEVDAVGVFTRSDASAFELWVRTVALWERALGGEALDRDREGTPRAVPVSSIVQLTRVAAALAARFRCDPASRGAAAVPIAAEPAEVDDPDDLRPIGEAPPRSAKASLN